MLDYSYDRTSAETPYSGNAGFIQAAPNQFKKGWVVVYDAKAQGIPGGKYLVVCEVHGAHYVGKP